MAIQHFRSSFSNGDSNYEAQFWYARELFMKRSFQESEQFFLELARGHASASVRNAVRGIQHDEQGQPRRYSGQIVKKEASYVFIHSEELGRDIFAHISESQPEAWMNMVFHDEVSFELGFTYRGPAAINVRLATN